MKILLINHYAGSLAYGMEYRPYYMAREWIRQGHTVQVVSAAWSHVRTVQPRTSGCMTREKVDGIDYLWISAPPYQGNGIGRVFNICVFCARLSLSARRLARDFSPDVVIASSTYPMDIWPASLIARAADAKLVHEIHDLWPLSPIELGGMSPSHPFIRVCQAAENYACRRSDVVVSMLPCVQEHLRSHGLDLGKLHVVPNGVLVDEWEQPGSPLASDLESRIAGAHQQGKFVVTYAGAHGIANALDNLLDAAVLLSGEPFEFVLVGDGPERARLLGRVEREALTNVHMFRAISKRQIPSLLAIADVAYIGLQREPIFRFGIAPNKLMDYMMAGCVVLSAIEAGNDPVSEAGCGVSVAAETPEAVVEGLRLLASMSATQRRAMGQRGRAYVSERHTWSVLARRFVEAIS